MLHKRSIKEELLKGGAWAFAGKVITGLSGLMITVLLTRLLDPDELAAYFLAFSLVACAALLAQLGLAQSIVRFIAESLAIENFTRARSAIQHTFMLAVGGSIFAGLVLLSGGWSWVSQNIAHSSSLDYIALVSVFWVISIAAQNLLAEIFRGFGSIKLASIFGGFLSSIITLILFACLYWISGEARLSQVVLISSLAVCASALLALPIITRMIVKLPHIGVPISPTEVFKVSMPLWGSFFFLFVLSQADIWLLALFRPQDEVAIYGAVARLALSIALPLTIINAVVPPLMARFYAQGRNQELEKILRTIATLSGIPLMLVILVLIPFGGSVLRILFGPFYEEGALALTILCVGQIVNVWSGSAGQLIIQAGRQVDLLTISILSGAVAIIATLFLVQLYGYNGAAAGTMLGIIFHNTAMWFRCKKQIGIDTSVYPPSKFGQLYSYFRSKFDEKVINSTSALLDMLMSFFRRADQFFWKVQGKSVLECYGDSHIAPLLMLNSKLKKNRLIINSVRGATALGITNPNSKTNAMQIFDKMLSNNNTNQDILFCLGEVDCGFLIWMQAQSCGGNTKSILEKAVISYTSFIKRYRNDGYKLYVLSAPLPTIKDDTPIGEIANLRKEVKATQLQRTELTLQFNDETRKWCEKSGVIYVGMDDFVLDKSTSLVKEELLNKNPLDHHYDSIAYCELFEKAIKGKLL